MGKGANGALTLAEKYELLRKKQAEKAITKKEPETLTANEKLAEMLAKKREAEQQNQPKKRVRKLPTHLQRALKEDPSIFEREIPVATPEEKPQTTITTTLNRRRRVDDDDKEYFVRKDNYNPNEYRNRNDSNRTYTDADGIEYFTCTVFVGDISPEADDYQLEEAFRMYGQIISARIINDKPYGFVKFKYEEDARRAIAEMNGHLLCGTPIRVSSAKVPTHKPHYRRGNYPGLNQSRGSTLDVLPDRDGHTASVLQEEEEDYGHLGADDSISERTLVTYDDI